MKHLLLRPAVPENSNADVCELSHFVS